MAEDLGRQSRTLYTPLCSGTLATWQWMAPFSYRKASSQITTTHREHIESSAVPLSQLT